MTSRVTVLRNIRGHSYGLSRQKSTENPQLTVTVTVTVTYTVTVTKPIYTHVRFCQAHVCVLSVKKSALCDAEHEGGVTREQ